MWQVESDYTIDRYQMLHGLLQVVEECVLFGPSQNVKYKICKLVELRCFQNASDIYEYRNPSTVLKRMQFYLNLNMRKYKLPRLVATKSVLGVKKVPTRRMERRSDRKALLFVSEFPIHLLQCIVSFMDGRAVIQLQRLNQYGKKMVPKVMRSLTCTVSELNRVLRPKWVLKCNALQTLVVKHDEGKLYTSSEVLKQVVVPMECTAVNQEEVIGEFGRLVMMGYAKFENLRVLWLNSTFSNTKEGNAIGAIGKAVCRLSCLKELHVGGNYLGDQGVVSLIQKLEETKEVYRLPKLALIDVRSNFIGNRGCQALKRSKEKGMLRYVHSIWLQGNVVDTTCVPVLMALLKCTVDIPVHHLALAQNALSKQELAVLLQVSREETIQRMKDGNVSIIE